MKLISTDFSNLGKKTIYDFGDDEAIDELFKGEKSTRDEITRDFFDKAETLVRFQWMRDLAGILQHFDSNAKNFFKVVNKEIDKYFKEYHSKAKDGWIVD